MATDVDTHSDLAIPPGEYLEEVLDELGMTKDELARRMSRPASKLSPIFKGDKAITPETALQLEMVVGVPAHIWLGLEGEYRLALARRESEADEQQLKQEARLVRAHCYAQLAKLGVVAVTTRPTEKVRELRRFFGVASLNAVPNVHRYEVAFREGAPRGSGCAPEAVASWLRLAERQAAEIDAVAFDRTRLQCGLGEIRAMTLQEPEAFLPRLSELLASAGVAFVLLPHFPGTHTHGATFRTGTDRAVLAMTTRGAWADIFWFSLFHEIGHLLLHGKREVIIESDNGDTSHGPREREADDFARDTLMATSDYARFVAATDFRPPAITAFADSIGIAPGVVVGRLQHDDHLRHEWGNQLRVRYRWGEDAARSGGHF
jgi:HTH-type transcriptional regulator/antitoxin HigA